MLKTGLKLPFTRCDFVSLYRQFSLLIFSSIQASITRFFSLEKPHFPPDSTTEYEAEFRGIYRADRYTVCWLIKSLYTLLMSTRNVHLPVFQSIRHFSPIVYYTYNSVKQDHALFSFALYPYFIFIRLLFFLCPLWTFLIANTLLHPLYFQHFHFLFSFLFWLGIAHFSHSHNRSFYFPFTILYR